MLYYVVLPQLLNFVCLIYTTYRTNYCTGTLILSGNISLIRNSWFVNNSPCSVIFVVYIKSYKLDKKRMKLIQFKRINYIYKRSDC